MAFLRSKEIARLAHETLGRTADTNGGHLGAGLDLHLSRHWSFGLSAGYNWMADFSEAVGARDNYSGFGATVNLGFLFGKATQPAE